MPNKKFLKHWDSVWEFLEDLGGVVILFCMIPIVLLCGYVLQ